MGEIERRNEHLFSANSICQTNIKRSKVAMLGVWQVGNRSSSLFYRKDLIIWLTLFLDRFLSVRWLEVRVFSNILQIRFGFQGRFILNLVGLNSTFLSSLEWVHIGCTLAILMILVSCLLPPFPFPSTHTQLNLTFIKFMYDF